MKKGNKKVENPDKICYNGNNHKTKTERRGFSMVEQLIPIFCDVDDFCKGYEAYCTQNLLMDKQRIIPKTSMSLSEIMTIVICFHLSHYRTFKWYYKDYVCVILREYFPRLVSYNRFIEIMQSAIAPLILYLMKCRLGKSSGINFVDSTTLCVCDSHRINSNRVFAGVAKRGKSSTGWFYGFKLHIAINENGDILSFCLTAGNVDDRNWKVLEFLTREMFGKLFADKGYLSPKLFEKLWERGIQLVTKVKKNMKNKLLDFTDKLLLRKRAVIESVNDFLKNICQIEHSRYRSVSSFLINVISGLIAYSFLPSKPSLHISPFDQPASLVFS